ncbi:hypothetical protein ACHAXA_003043 [Cyclostephanos tholiformis]|uniref:Nucleotide-diphospho-sugar transferase domain-containing protein n=1 Tax=Cyclostephanos tholiformis TaxID=382380 RepID=A0ABD3RYL3_9STRA
MNRNSAANDKISAMNPPRMSLSHWCSPTVAMILLVSTVVNVSLVVYFGARNHFSSVPSARHNKLRLIHAMNVYSIPGKPGEDNTFPFQQWSTVESIKRARQYAPQDLDIDFVCALFESDRDALSGLPCRMVNLTRSTKTEYPFIKKSKELPFIQDIIDAAVAQDKDGDGEFFLMLTNSDIGLTKYFYRNIMPHLKIREAMSINRLVVEAERIHITDDGGSLLSQVDSALDSAEKHGGYDCFIVHSSALQRIWLGDMFAGYPPWGTVMHRLLMLTAANYTNIKANVNGTFHIGDDRSHWKGDDWSTDDIASYFEFEKIMLMDQQIMSPNTSSLTLQNLSTVVLKKCPWGKVNNVYSRINKLNCAIGLQHTRFRKNRAIPAFIQPGFEAYCKDACNMETVSWVNINK